MVKEVGSLFEATIHNANSSKTFNDVVVLVHNDLDYYMSVKSKQLYKGNSIVFLHQLKKVREINKKYLKFHFYRLNNAKTYIVTVTNYKDQYLSLIKYSGYTYKEFRTDSTMFDYWCNSDIVHVLKLLSDERKGK